MNLAEAFATYLPLIEAEMRRLLEPRNPRAARHYEIMQYHMGWRDEELQPADAPAGKRIRPMLCLLAARRRAVIPETALPAAAGLELLHNFSLIHDDIEDNSATRRHRPTAWSLWGVPIACNVGDGMFSLAHAAFFELADAGRARARRPGRAAALRRDEPGAHRRAVHGHVVRGPARRHRRRVLCDDRGQDGRAAGAAPEIGALIGGRGAGSARWRYREYGAALGRAFQLQDDILGIWGDEKQTGKSAASDILTKKKSLPVVLALNHEAVGKRLRTLYAGPDFTPEHVPGGAVAARPGRRARGHRAGGCRKPPPAARPRCRRSPSPAATASAAHGLLARAARHAGGPARAEPKPATRNARRPPRRDQRPGGSLRALRPQRAASPGNAAATLRSVTGNATSSRSSERDPAHVRVGHRGSALPSHLGRKGVQGDAEVRVRVLHRAARVGAPARPCPVCSRTVRADRVGQRPRPSCDVASGKAPQSAQQAAPAGRLNDEHGAVRMLDHGRGHVVVRRGGPAASSRDAPRRCRARTPGRTGEPGRPGSRARPGVQTSAPSSISASLNSPARPGRLRPASCAG